MARDPLSPSPVPALLNLSAARKPPQYAMTARARISVLVPQRPWSRKSCHCTFTIFCNHAEGLIEDADGMVSISEGRPKEVARDLWQFLRLNRRTVATVALWFDGDRGPVPPRMRSAAKRAYAWLVRQLKKHARRAA